MTGVKERFQKVCGMEPQESSQYARRLGWCMTREAGPSKLQEIGRVNLSDESVVSESMACAEKAVGITHLFGINMSIDSIIISNDAIHSAYLMQVLVITQ